MSKKSTLSTIMRAILHLARNTFLPLQDTLATPLHPRNIFHQRLHIITEVHQLLVILRLPRNTSLQPLLMATFPPNLVLMQVPWVQAMLLHPKTIFPPPLETATFHQGTIMLI